MIPRGLVDLEDQLTGCSCKRRVIGRDGIRWRSLNDKVIDPFENGVYAMGMQDSMQVSAGCPVSHQAEERTSITFVLDINLTMPGDWKVFIMWLGYWGIRYAWIMSRVTASVTPVYMSRSRRCGTYVSNVGCM